MVVGGGVATNTHDTIINAILHSPPQLINQPAPYTLRAQVRAHRSAAGATAAWGGDELDAAEARLGGALCVGALI